MAANTMGMPYGLQAMLKDGHKHFSGVEEAVMKSVEACKAIAKCTRTSLGPTGEWGRKRTTIATDDASLTRRERRNRPLLFLPPLPSSPVATIATTRFEQDHSEPLEQGLHHERRRHDSDGARGAAPRREASRPRR